MPHVGACGVPDRTGSRYHSSPTMCTRAARAAFLIVAASLLLPRTALAQARIAEDKMVLRAAWGHGVSGSQSTPDGAHAWTVALDRHIRSDWWVRAQAQHIGAMDLSPRALSPTNAAQVSLSSVAIAAYKLIGTPGVP